MSISPNATRSRDRAFKVPGLRWWIAGLLLVATLISYIDRLTLSILAPAICDDLHLTNLQYAGINVWFLLAYSFGQAIFGKLQDRIGTKPGLVIAMTIWSIAEMMHAVTRTLGGLSVFRFSLVWAKAAIGLPQSRGSPNGFLERNVPLPWA